MSVEPQSIERFLNVPDLVGNVFKWLDPASRRAFFQSHPLVAHAGLVLAQSELRIQLSPYTSLEDQWQRVLFLTKSQPLHSLVVAGPNKDRLLDFLRYIPHPKDRQHEKQRVLQGTEVQLQAVAKLGLGGIPQLQKTLSSWREEQQRVFEGAVLWHVLDLCSRELTATTEGDVEPPNWCTLRNGTLQLSSTSCVRVGKCYVRLEDLTFKGKQVSVEGGRLELVGCLVEGGGDEDEEGEDVEVGAVRVVGSTSSLSAVQTTLYSSSGSGLEVAQASRATLEECTMNENGWHGAVVTHKDSVLHAKHCNMDLNWGDNIRVVFEACASLEDVTSHNSETGNGWSVDGENSSMRATDSTASGNKASGAAARDGSLMLVRCECRFNENFGWRAVSSGSIVAEDSCTRNNIGGNRAEIDGGRITCRNCDLGER